MSAKAPFPIDPELSAVAINYANRNYIADRVLPRASVGTQVFKYWEYSKEDRFTVPETRVGRTGRVNTLEFGATETEASTVDHALDNEIPQADLNNAPAGKDIRAESVNALQNMIQLDREVRTAGIVFDANNYPTGNKQTLVGNNKWDVYGHADSTPIEDILAALDACLVRPNIMVIGGLTFTKLSNHPTISKAVNGTSGDTSIVRAAQIAELFELEEVIIGRAKRNTAKKGQTLTLSPVWGDFCALHHRDQAATNRTGVTWGLTFQWGERVAGSEMDSSIGMRGGERVRSGESVVEKMVANEAGYLFSDLIG